MIHNSGSFFFSNLKSPPSSSLLRTETPWRRRQPGSRLAPPWPRLPRRQRYDNGAWGEQQPGSDGDEEKTLSFFSFAVLLLAQGELSSRCARALRTRFRSGFVPHFFIVILDSIAYSFFYKASTSGEEMQREIREECACIMLFPVRRRRRGVGLIECSSAARCLLYRSPLSLTSPLRFLFSFIPTDVLRAPTRTPS